MTLAPGPMTADLEVGEATLAVVGLTNVLNGEMPRIGVEKQRQIIGYGAKLDDLAKQLVYDELPRRVSMPRPFTYRALLEKFLRPIPEVAVAQIMMKFPPDAHDIALSFMSTLTQTWAHLKEMVPVATYETWLGPRPIPPTSDKTFDFFNQYWVIADPEVTFSLIQCGAIIPSQAGALREFFPSIWERMRLGILEAMAARQRAEPKWLNLPPRADRGLSTFLGKRVVPFNSNQRVAKPEEPQEMTQPLQKPKETEGLKTPGERAALP